MPQMSASEISTLKLEAKSIASEPRRKVVELALELEGNSQITWQGGGNLENFLNYSNKDRTPKTGAYISLVCWLWPIYLAWRAKVATDRNLVDYRNTQNAAVNTASLLNQPGKMSFGGRDESAMAAAAFYRAGISKEGLGIPGDVVFYYRSGYEQPAHIAVQVSNIHVSSLWTVPRDSKGLDFMWPQAVASVDLVAEILLNTRAASVVTRSQVPPWGG